MVLFLQFFYAIFFSHNFQFLIKLHLNINYVKFYHLRYYKNNDNHKNFVLFQQIIEKYNKFDYKIIGENNLINNVIYIYFEQENQKIPINKSKLYDISLPNDFEIDKITIDISMCMYKYERRGPLCFGYHSITRGEQKASPPALNQSHPARPPAGRR